MSLSNEIAKLYFKVSGETKIAAETKPAAFGSYQELTISASSPGAEPRKIPRTEWPKRPCKFSDLYLFLSGRDTEPCGDRADGFEACVNCQKIQPFFFRLEYTREIPQYDHRVKKHLAVTNLPLSFKLADGCHLLIFKSEQEAKNSLWGTARFIHGVQYIFEDQNVEGQYAVCFHCCKVCNRMELKSVKEVDQALFCSKGAKVNKKAKQENNEEVKLKQENHEVVKSKDEAKAKKENLAVKYNSHTITPLSQTYGNPAPPRFVFNESKFPMDISLPAEILKKKDAQGQHSYLSADDILVFFDDVLMPHRVDNNCVIVELHRNPFEKLYRPNEYNALIIPLTVYLNHKKANIPTPGLVLKQQGPRLTALLEQPQPKQTMEHAGGNKVTPNQEFSSDDIIYESFFRIYMSTPSFAYLGSGNEPEELYRPSRNYVVGFGNFLFTDFLKLPWVTYPTLQTLCKVIQGYLRAGFYSWKEQDYQYLDLIYKLNSTFKIAAKGGSVRSREYAAIMLIEVALYYAEHYQNDRDFREGFLQLLDFAHALGTAGSTAFKKILDFSPFAQTKKPIRFCFSRYISVKNVRNDQVPELQIRNVFVTYKPKTYNPNGGVIFETIDNQEQNATGVKKISDHELKNTAEQQDQSSLEDTLFPDFYNTIFLRVLNESVGRLSHINNLLNNLRIHQNEVSNAKFAAPTGLYRSLYFTSEAQTSSNAKLPSSEIPTIKTDSETPFSEIPSSEIKDSAEKLKTVQEDDPLVNPNLIVNNSEHQSLNEQLNKINILVGSYPRSYKVDENYILNLRNACQEAGYMNVMDVKNIQVSDITKLFWQAMLNWAAVLWPFDLSTEVQGSINETKFVSIMGTWLNSEQYKECGVAYTRKLHVSHLRKLFKLYTNAFAPKTNALTSETQDANSKPIKSTPVMEPIVQLMGPIAFVQCVGLMLLPNEALRPNHLFLPHHGPLNLGCAIDGIYDLLDEPKSNDWLPLYRGPISRGAAEAAWAHYTSVLVKKGVELPMFLRLPEVRVDNIIAYGLNLMMCFVKTRRLQKELRKELMHCMLAVDVFDKENNCSTKILDAELQPQNYLGQNFIKMFDKFSFQVELPYFMEPSPKFRGPSSE